MATCKKCKCEPQYCGCSDAAITVSPPCEQGTVFCPTPDPCPETFSASCVVYTGNDIVDVNITQGDRLDAIIQRLALLIVSPGCINPTASCNAVVGVNASYISQTIVTISWLGTSTATSYALQYRDPSDPGNPWLARPSVQPTQLYDSVGGLAAGTEYQFRVVTTCAVGSCNSLVISLTTLS